MYEQCVRVWIGFRMKEMLTSIPRCDLWLETIDGVGICLSKPLIGAGLHHLELQEGLRTTKNVDERSVSLGHLLQSLGLALLLVESSICFLTMAIV